MTFNIEGQLLDTILDTLQAATAELSKSREQIQKLQAELDLSELLNEEQAMAYLKRDANTLLYYRKHGLPYYKYGRDVWFKKSDINTWLEEGRVNRRHHK